MDQKILDLLYRSFDGQLLPEEQQRLEEALASSKQLRDEKERIVALRKTISGNAAQSFEPFFAERVMQRITAEMEQKLETVEDFFNSLLWSFRRVALAGAIAVLLLFANNLLRADDLSLDSLLAMPQLTIEDTWAINDLIEGELQ
jgi:anti-sigma factor RsiW